jgi:hypothetical protein
MRQTANISLARGSGNGSAEAVCFDPFGEPLETAQAAPAPAAPRDGAGHRAVAAAFWGLALLLVGCRVYLSDYPVAQTVASVGEAVRTHLAAAF